MLTSHNRTPATISTIKIVSNGILVQYLVDFKGSKVSGCMCYITITKNYKIHTFKVVGAFLRQDY